MPPQQKKSGLSLHLFTNKSVSYLITAAGVGPAVGPVGVVSQDAVPEEPAEGMPEHQGEAGERERSFLAFTAVH